MTSSPSSTIRPLRRLDQPVDHLHGGRLAAARRADQADQLAGAHLQVELLHGHGPVGVALADALQADHGARTRGGSVRACLRPRHASSVGERARRGRARRPGLRARERVVLPRLPAQRPFRRARRGAVAPGAHRRGARPRAARRGAARAGRTPLAASAGSSRSASAGWSTRSRRSRCSCCSGPLFGFTSSLPVVIALAAYDVQVLLRQLLVGLDEVPADAVEAAVGTGYGRRAAAPARRAAARAARRARRAAPRRGHDDRAGHRRRGRRARRRGLAALRRVPARLQGPAAHQPGRRGRHGPGRRPAAAAAAARAHPRRRAGVRTA